MGARAAGKFLIETGNSAGYSCLVQGALMTGPGGEGEEAEAAAAVGGILFESLGSGNIAFATFPAVF